ncbi:RloB family protein [Dickeya dianthicola]|uniref:RloB family protein n=1 Tax=Dickeya dianthicola TaxID=204039 RepID=UPI003017CCE7
MPRERRKFDRISGVKNPSLIVIACEGEKTEQQYFSSISERCNELGSRLQLKILEPRQEGYSAPKYVLDQMDKYRKDFGINKHDELCLVIDRDEQAWAEAAISEVAQHCHAKQYVLALSNPCFELWLLIHYCDISTIDDQEKNSILRNKNGFMKKKIREVIGEYNSSSINIDHFWDLTRTAIDRAKNLDINPSERWPNEIGSRVYIIMEKIIESFNNQT